MQQQEGRISIQPDESLVIPVSGHSHLSCGPLPHSVATYNRFWYTNSPHLTEQKKGSTLSFSGFIHATSWDKNM